MDIRQGEIRERNSNTRSMGLSQHIAEKLLLDQDKTGGHFEQLHRSRVGEVSACCNSVNFKLADCFLDTFTSTIKSLGLAVVITIM